MARPYSFGQMPRRGKRLQRERWAVAQRCTTLNDGFGRRGGREGPATHGAVKHHSPARCSRRAGWPGRLPSLTGQAVSAAHTSAPSADPSRPIPGASCSSTRSSSIPSWCTLRIPIAGRISSRMRSVASASSAIDGPARTAPAAGPYTTTASPRLPATTNPSSKALQKRIEGDGGAWFIASSASVRVFPEPILWAGSGGKPARGCRRSHPELASSHLSVLRRHRSRLGRVSYPPFRFTYYELCCEVDGGLLGFWPAGPAGRGRRVITRRFLDSAKEGIETCLQDWSQPT